MKTWVSFKFYESLYSTFISFAPLALVSFDHLYQVVINSIETH